MTADPAEDFAQSLAAMISFMSGTGGVMSQVPGLRSRLAQQTIEGPVEWLLPVISTEAAPRLASRHLPSGTQHYVIWDERYAHYLGRLIELVQGSILGLSAGTCGADTVVRCMAAIGWDYVTEQLYPGNAMMLRAPSTLRARRVVAAVYAQRQAAQAEDAKLIESLTQTPAMMAAAMQKLMRITYGMCRDLVLDHEAHHYLQRHEADWGASGGISLAEAGRRVVGLLAGWRRVMITGARPRGRAWPFFARMLSEIPLDTVPDFDGTPLGEEILSDLVPLLLMCGEAKAVVEEGISEPGEFKLISTLFQAQQTYAIVTLFLQGLRLEAARAIGMKLQDSAFDETDLGLRVMTSRFLAYQHLCDPPYASRDVVDTELDPAFIEDVAKHRRIAEAYPTMKGDDEHAVQRKHRALFLDRCERSNQTLLQLLNLAGLQIADALAAAAEGPAQPVPKADALLDLTGFHPAWRRRAVPGLMWA